jgi:hypothetical protein
VTARYRFIPDTVTRYDHSGMEIETVTVFAVYDGDEEIGYLLTEGVAQQVVDLLNRADAAAAAEVAYGKAVAA